MILTQLKQDIKQSLNDLGVNYDDIVISISVNSRFGDYSSNVSLQLSKLGLIKNYQNPIEFAKILTQTLEGLEYLKKVEVAGPGFINFYIKDETFLKSFDKLGSLEKVEPVKKILIEYGHVNFLKEVHIGHLRTFILGESLCRIFESLGHKVFRANYQGDIGLHIAKAIWGIDHLGGLPKENLNLEEKAKFLGQAYAQGNKSYDEDSQAKEDILKLTKQLYERSPKINNIFQVTREWSLAYFEPIYHLLGIEYDRCFFESEVYESGKRIVLEHLGTVFEEDQRAVIFRGEKYGLHNRVFVTNRDNPTYEAKELGLAQLEYDSFNYDRSIHVVANEQGDYFKVVIKVIDLIFPYLRGKKFHFSYGFVDLKEGKMSSRTGNIISFDDLYKRVLSRVEEIMSENKVEFDQDTTRQIAIGAIKFAYLKFSPEPNMTFDLEESVSLQGNSGPYVQYTYTRTQSILRNAQGKASDFENNFRLDLEETELMKIIDNFSNIVETAASDYRPNIIADYLLNLARNYNLFYQKYRVLDSDKERFRLALTAKVGEILRLGLFILGIETPERM